MRLHNPAADIFVPDGSAPEAALARTTHLCVAAHQDDIEIMAYHGIAECFGQAGKWFSGVVVTNGAGSPRSGIYGSYTDEQMQEVRRQEQRKAAFVGEYSIMVQLGYPSDDLKNSRKADVSADILKVLTMTRPQFVYLHNPADRHDTHVATFLRCLEAL